MARKQPKELSDAEFDVAIQADLDARLVPRPRTYTEAELQSAVAGAYRDMSARIRESADADTKWNRISVGTQNLLHYIADGIDKRTPASAQKAFADAVAAERKAEADKWRAVVDKWQTRAAEQVNRITEEKERLRVALSGIMDESHQFYDHYNDCLYCDVRYGSPHKETCSILKAEDALTPAAGGETKKHEPQ